jgi:hypothetical protein
MENVVGIIDMGDHQINKKFFCKDLAWRAENWRNISQFIFFSILAFVGGTLTKEDKVTCAWARRSIRGASKLPFGVLPNLRVGRYREKRLR